MLPAPGVYEALMTLLQMMVSACTIPANFEIPALKVNMLAETSTANALTLTCVGDVTVIPLASNLTELPWLSTISIASGPSVIVTL
jgi:hypothetical protein